MAVRSLDVPSGRVFNALDIAICRLMFAKGTIQRKEQPFTLSSGALSKVYVFGREDITDNPELEWLIGRKVVELVRKFSLRDDRQPCLIGIPTAGTAIAQAGAMVAYANRVRINGFPICHRIMREALKEHGADAHRKWVNGEPNPSLHTYWKVDNVITFADAKFKANDRFRESGYPADEMPDLIWVDRQQGGVKKMQESGFKRVVVAYLLLDLTYAAGEFGLWPKEWVKATEEEIKVFQS